MVSKQTIVKFRLKAQTEPCKTEYPQTLRWVILREASYVTSTQLTILILPLSSLRPLPSALCPLPSAFPPCFPTLTLT
jgi:hypothetical protein